MKSFTLEGNFFFNNSSVVLTDRRLVNLDNMMFNSNKKMKEKQRFDKSQLKT